MSVQMWNIDPPSGVLTVWIPDSGEIPASQNWLFGVEVCSDENSTETNGLAATLEIQQPGPLEQNAGAVKVTLNPLRSNLDAPEGCISQGFTAVVSIRPEWPDALNQDGSGTAIISYPSGPSLNLQIHWRGRNPTPETLSAILGSDFLRALCWQESRWRHFGQDGLPLRNHNSNGTTDWGCMQINQANNRQIWHWPSNIAHAKDLFEEKVHAARGWLGRHPPFTDEMVDNESIQRYNGGAYYHWDDSAQVWTASPRNGYVASVRKIIAQEPWPKPPATDQASV